MSFHEIKEHLPQLTPTEREVLMLHLQQLAALDEPETMAEMAHRLDDLEAGRHVVSELELKARIAAKP